MSTLITHLPYRLAVGHKDRLGVTLFFAMAMHAIIILGVSFDLEDLTNPDKVATMEVTLVHSKTEEAPEDADYLAQANQLGGGNVQEKVRPSSPFSNLLPTPDQGFAPNSRKDMLPPQTKEKQQQREVLSVTDSKRRTKSKPEAIPLPNQKRSLTYTQFLERSSEMARLSPEINHQKKAYARVKHHTYINGANAREYRFASYRDAWRAKVEHIGNLNYPSELNRRSNFGKVLLDVAINPDGSLHAMKILRSSGNPIIDRAAKRIVRMSSPFSPLPEQILKDTDILHIVREWRFQESGLATTSQ